MSREGIKAKKLADYLDVVSISPKKKTVRYSLYTSRADLNMRYRKGSKHGRFCEVEAKRCKNGFFAYTSNALGQSF